LSDVVHRAFIDIKARFGLQFEALLGPLNGERNIKDREDMTGVMNLANM
jgi:hypothetical protein